MLNSAVLTVCPLGSGLELAAASGRRDKQSRTNPDVKITSVASEDMMLQEANCEKLLPLRKENQVPPSTVTYCLCDTYGLAFSIHLLDTFFYKDTVGNACYNCLEKVLNCA